MKKKVVQAIKEDETLSGYQIEVFVSADKIVTLTGEVDDWQQVVDCGHLIAKIKGVRNIVNDMTAKGIVIPKRDRSMEIQQAMESGNETACDIVVIGAGIAGCAIARELAKYQVKTIVLEKNSDVAEEATKANNGNIHPGVLAKPGTLKAKLNLKGNEMYTQLSKELNFELQRPGSLNVIYQKSEWRKMKALQVMKKTGLGHLVPPLRQVMKVPGLKWLTGEEVKKMEPNLKGEPIGGFWMTTMGLVEPYEVCIAMAENAVENGTEFRLNAEVLDVLVENGRTVGVVTNQGIIRSEIVINCAGVYTDAIAEMANDRFFTIHPRRGAMAIIDKSRKGFLKTPAGIRGGKEAEKNNTKGGGASVTPEGNLLWGPTAVEIPWKEDKSVEASDLDYITKLGMSVTNEVKRSEIITFFAGIRAADYMEDFIIERSRKVGGLIHVAGIQSPGLASAPAIAEMVAGLVYEERGGLLVNPAFNPIRKAKPQFRHLSHEEQDALIQKNSKYGNIICRCELITEGEILDAIHAPIPATTVDAVKRRTRSGMGRCQGGFCGPRVLEILARELEKEPTEITLKGKDSFVLKADSRQPQKGGSHERTEN
jgi:glycerol-3-phosphate dehydrogenase